MNFSEDKQPLVDAAFSRKRYFVHLRNSGSHFQKNEGKRHKCLKVYPKNRTVLQQLVAVYRHGRSSTFEIWR